MSALQRVVFNILCKDVGESAAFYQQLAGFEPIHTSHWYVVLAQPGNGLAHIGLIDEVSEFTPRHAWGTRNGSFLTLVVEDIFVTMERARLLGAEIIEQPVALDTGFTRALIRDPNGLVIDISTPSEVLAARGDVEFEISPRTTAIDQQQPEERGRSPV